jgi:ABC-type transporter Mla subunit MlaD
MPEPLRLRFVNPIVGGFLLVVLALALAFLLLLMRITGRSASHVEFEVRVPQSELGGLRKGAEVEIMGQTAGRIDRIDYAEQDGRLVLGLAIKSRYARQIFTDSTVHVRHKHGGSAAYLEILRGERSETPLVDIAKDEPIEIEHFQPPQDRIEELADEIRKLRELVEKSLSPSVAE